MNKHVIIIFVGCIFFTTANAGLINSVNSPFDSVYIRALDYYDESEDSSTIVEITYPKLFGLQNRSVEDRINTFFEEEFFKSLEFFEEFVTMLDSFPTIEYEYGMYFSFETGFDIKLMNESFLSIVLNHYEFTGGAHGNFYSVGYTIDLKSGNLLTLEDILHPNSMDEIISLCEEKILEAYAAETLTDAGLFEDNLELNFEQDFFVINDALVIQFDPYEIAPFSMGNIEIILPLKEIENHIMLTELIQN